MSSNKHNNSDDGWAFAILCAYLWEKHKINKEERKSKPMSTTKVPFLVSFLVIVVCIITIVLALNFENKLLGGITLIVMSIACYQFIKLFQK